MSGQVSGEIQERNALNVKRVMERRLWNDAYRARGWYPDVERDGFVDEYYPWDELPSGLWEAYLEPQYPAWGEALQSLKGDLGQRDCPTLENDKVGQKKTVSQSGQEQSIQVDTGEVDRSSTRETRAAAAPTVNASTRNNRSERG